MRKKYSDIVGYIAPSVPIAEPWPAGVEHIVLPRGELYELGDKCSVNTWALDEWPGDFHLLVNHSPSCDCPSRGKVFKSAFDPMRPTLVRPPPVVKT